MSELENLRQISPVRNSTEATTASELATEQLSHFGIDPNSTMGKHLMDLSLNLYNANISAHNIWDTTLRELNTLDRSDRSAWFNAKRFISFQLAKILDTLQNPMRATYQSLFSEHGGFAQKGPYPLFDNVTALFSASPVITRTATYLFACTEWVEDAFTGREPLHEIYSRLLNPTSIALANHMVDLECGPESQEYLAWNYNSGMAAIDGLLAHQVGYEDIILSSRNIYGGSYQLLHDWYGKESNLSVGLEWFDGYDGASFKEVLDKAEAKYAARIENSRKIYVYLESPCNPHGNVLDVPEICRIAHERGWIVMCDSTVGTPFLHPVLKHEDKKARPDFVIHSYTKEMTGGGATTAGVVIGRAERMFQPKGNSVTIEGPDGKDEVISWDETMFWSVYYIKGAFLDADKAFEVMSGLKTYEMRIINKAANTLTLAKIFEAHPMINVNCPALENNSNHEIFRKQMFNAMPAGLFTIDFERSENGDSIDKDTFKRFFDSLEPAIGMQVSLGQNNTLALCPALTSHSELSEDALKKAGIMPTTVRISVGLEDPRRLIAHMKEMGSLIVDPAYSEFSAGFMDGDAIDHLYRETYKEMHRNYIDTLPGFADLQK